jgi:type II secretory pathway component GspD/PulD (secretin)
VEKPIMLNPRRAVVDIAFLLGIVCFLSSALCGADDVTQDAPKESLMPLRRASAEDVAKKLSRLLGKDGAVKIAFDKSSNTVVIQANAETTERARKIADRLDVGVEPGICCVRLKFASAPATAKTLKVILTLTAFLDDDDRFTIAADEKTNLIFFTGTATKIRLIKEILQRLDVQLSRVAGKAYVVMLPNEDVQLARKLNKTMA